MSRADASATPEGGPPARGPSALSLYAASVRNVVPRIISAVAVAAVLAGYVGWAWAVGWLGLVLGSQFVSARLMAVAQARGAAPSEGFWLATRANSLAGIVLQSAAIVGIWETGEPIAQAFALLSCLIGCCYILLQFYADLPQFRLLLTPYALTLAYMAGRLAWDAGVTVPAAITVGAATVMMVNFLFASRQLLDRSRAALRQARAQAQEKELAAQAASRAKSAFLATMSHEIRTPLNGVLGMAQAMASEKLSERQRDRLSVIHRSGEALLAILNDLLDLSKIEAGKLELESIEFDLDEVARGAYSAFTALANRKGLSFALDVEPARGRYRGDPTRLRQILYNLISNALKFTEQGEIRVTARREGEWLAISVTDTGVGISAENLGRLFAKFDQLDSSTTRRFGGTGLGLSICRELAQLMGGDISVTSQEGEGSCFTFRAPLPRVGEAKGPARLAPSAPANLPAVGLRVLAAEDNAVNQLVLKTLLHQLGVEPVVVDSGAAAVEAWEGAPWDAILMDIQMPGMDGLTATALIRAREMETGRRRTPIVALTANAMAHQVKEYLAAGMDDHVAKPIEVEALFRVLCDVTAQAERTASRVA